MKISLFILVVLLVACSDSNDCQVLVEEQKFESAVSLCEKEFLNDGQSSTLIAWVTSVGELGRTDEFENILRNISNQEVLADGLLVAAKYSFLHNNYFLAKKYYSKSVNIFSQNKKEKQLMQALSGSFFVAWNESDHRQALSFASQSLALAKKINDSQEEIAALKALFDVFQEIGSLGKAQQVMSLLDKKLEGDDSSPMRINAHISRGLLNMDLHRYGMAEHDFKLALKAASGSKNRNALRGLHLNIVHANIELQRLQIAAEHMKSAWSYANEDGSNRFALLYYQSLLQFHNGFPKQAYELMLQALDDPQLPQVWVWEMDYWAGKAAHAMGDKEKAIESFLKSVKALDELRSGVEYDQLKSQLLSRKREPYE